MMNHLPFDMERVKALDQQLAENVVLCKRHNILVHVERINSKQSVAFCSVEQRRRGLFRRDRPSDYLAWQAEMALAPLRRHGITPLITVRDKSLGNTGTPPVRTTSPSFMQRVRGLWGASKSRVPVPADPFGWRQAMNLSGGPMMNGTETRVAAKPIDRIMIDPDAYRVGLVQQ